MSATSKNIFVVREEGVAPSRNPVPPRVWRAIKAILAEHGVEVLPAQYVIIDDKVQDEHTSFAVLYVKER